MSGSTQDYSIRRSARAKRVRLVVTPKGIELVVPHHLADQQALAFLSRCRPWAEQKLRELRGRLDEATPTRQLWSNGATLPFRGANAHLMITAEPIKRARLRFDGDFHITLPETLSPADRESLAARTVWRWTQARLLEEAQRLAAKPAARSGLNPSGWRVKLMRSRWGSCGPRGDINLNALLAFVPAEILDYVVVHELCHLRHRDHSPRFWALVGEHCPDYASRRGWLKQNGNALIHRLYP